jgi:D-amino-acid oxidase
VQTREVVVVGAGVVGLTCAVALLDAGFDVTVVARDEPGLIASEVMGGLWLPYSTGEDDRTLRWARATYDWLEQGGARLVDYLHLEHCDPGWLPALPPGRVRRAAPEEVPPERGRGWVARVPLVEVPAHLAALRARIGAIETATIDTLDGLAPLVVNCTGLGARRLAGDDAVVPIRGQVVHVRPPAGVEIPCVADEDEVTYVLPRRDVCILGGTHEEGDDDTAVRDEQSADIVARTTRLAPALAGAEVVGVRAGLRPGRRGGARVERVGDIVHCYGHGGAGLTLSWGCAQEVVELARAAPGALSAGPRR